MEYGRQGDIQGIFIADDDDVEAAYGAKLYFGEALGKHSNVKGTFKMEDIIPITDDQELIEKLESFFPGGRLSGYNPLDYISK